MTLLRHLAFCDIHSHTARWAPAEGGETPSVYPLVLTVDAACFSPPLFFHPFVCKNREPLGSVPTEPEIIAQHETTTCNSFCRAGGPARRNQRSLIAPDISQLRLHTEYLLDTEFMNGEGKQIGAAAATALNVCVCKLLVA